MIRSFLAFELPNDIKRTVKQVSEEIRRSTLDVRRVKVDNIHLTVVFIGNIRAEDLSVIQVAIEKACFRFGPFDISAIGIGAFPNTRRPRVLWLGLDGEIKRLSSLKDELHKQLKPFGLKEEKRSFKPHLTLARFRKLRKGGKELDDIIRRYKDLNGPVNHIDELILFKSELRPEGAKYTKLKSWLLTGER
ncbi:RNA 2',3'-cyclic phosphodiesterase [Thermodesulfobacteriota bacterium]